ncbi:hypothetical protein PtA15_7A282 [Puccinia triticina]|uniref:Uncharacterized protein n=1 Tax=Puccinia triticina TaxID=208348 RepID=A0ABY7CMW5_9BASI|nr:uncharacterized protein PtA15_7A282 [Puccinia triticina]WAQ86556.1 hypothetical protein PtA15_7A282 [Puccinia triticina]
MPSAGTLPAIFLDIKPLIISNPWLSCHCSGQLTPPCLIHFIYQSIESKITSAHHHKLARIILLGLNQEAKPHPIIYCTLCPRQPLNTLQTILDIHLASLTGDHHSQIHIYMLLLFCYPQLPLHSASRKSPLGSPGTRRPPPNLNTPEAALSSLLLSKKTTTNIESILLPRNQVN